MLTTSDKIRSLAARKNAVILAHYYTRPEVQDVADFVGDSLALSQKAAETDAQIIVFAGVRFMAETAKVLSPAKKVLIPDPTAGCSLADSCTAEGLAALKARYPGHTVVSYVNTSVEVKALTDVCCTSSNAERVIDSLKNEKIIFAPDRNLGNYLRKITGHPAMVVWDGACHVHEEFSVAEILKLKKTHPAAKVVAHPECKAPVLLVADFVGSTAAILDFCATDAASEYIVTTEAGILHQMARNSPQKRFYPVPPTDASCGCNDCAFMKQVTLQKIYDCLSDESPEITIDESLRAAAEGSIRRMLAL